MHGNCAERDQPVENVWKFLGAAFSRGFSCISVWKSFRDPQAFFASGRGSGEPHPARGAAGIAFGWCDWEQWVGALVFHVEHHDKSKITQGCSTWNIGGRLRMLVGDWGRLLPITGSASIPCVFRLLRPRLGGGRSVNGGPISVCIASPWTRNALSTERVKKPVSLSHDAGVWRERCSLQPPRSCVRRLPK